MIVCSRSQRPVWTHRERLIAGALIAFTVAGALDSATPLPARSQPVPAVPSGPDQADAFGITLTRGVARLELTETEAVESVLVLSAHGLPETVTTVACLPGTNEGPLAPLTPLATPSAMFPQEESFLSQPDPTDQAGGTIPNLRQGTASGPSVIYCGTEQPCTPWLLPQSTGAIRIETRPLVRCGRVRLDWDTRTTPTTTEVSACAALVEQVAGRWLPAVEARLGRCGVEGDAADLVLVLTPAVATVAATREPIEACVLPRDYDPRTSRLSAEVGGVIYIHPELSPARQPPILVHELAHVAALCRFRERYPTEPWPLHDWSSEGLAHAVELAVTGDEQNVAARLQAFAELPERSPLVVCDGRQVRRWRDPRCRGAACSFFVWASATYGLPRVAEAVYAAGQTDDPWHSAVATPWAEVYRQWTIDNARRGRVSIRPATTATIDLEGTATTYIRLPHGGRWDVHVPVDRRVTATLVRTAVKETNSPPSLTGG